MFVLLSPIPQRCHQRILPERNRKRANWFFAVVVFRAFFDRVFAFFDIRNLFDTDWPDVVPSAALLSPHIWIRIEAFARCKTSKASPLRSFFVVLYFQNVKYLIVALSPSTAPLSWLKGPNLKSHIKKKKILKKKFQNHFLKIHLIIHVFWLSFLIFFINFTKKIQFFFSKTSKNLWTFWKKLVYLFTNSSDIENSSRGNLDIIGS